MEGLNKSRKIHDAILVAGGAKLKPKGGIELTGEQHENARREMVDELWHIDQEIFEGISEILESKTFTIKEIQNLIVRIENVPSIILKMKLMDSAGNIVSMTFALPEEMSYSKYGKLVTYFFEIKGNLIDEDGVVSQNKVTSIDRYEETSDEAEAFETTGKFPQSGHSSPVSFGP